MPQYDLTYNPDLAAGSRLAWTIPASTPAPVTTRVLYASWRNFDNTASPNNASGTLNGADFYAGSGNSGPYRASLFVNVTPLTTGEGFLPIAGNTAPSGNYRLTRVGGGLTGNVPGFIEGTIDFRQPDNAGRRAIVVSPSVSATDRSQDMIDAFGTGTPNNGGTWLLERITTTTPPAEDLYRIIRRGSAVSNPAPTGASADWTAITPTAHSTTEGYPTVGTFVTDGGNLFSSLAVIQAVSATGTIYTEVARYNDSATSGKRASGGSAYHSIPELCVNHAAASGAFPSDTSGMFRLRYEPGGSATQAAASMTGNLTVLFEGNTANPYRCIRVGSIADFTATFGVGSSNATDNSPARFFGGTWILERVTSATPTATWRATPAASDGTARYNHTGMHLAVSSPSTNSGAFPTNLTGTWRLSQVGTNRTVDGALTIVNPASGGVMDIRVGSAAQMNTAFGPTAITSGGNFELRKIANAAPSIDTANWHQEIVHTWSGTQEYHPDEFVINNGSYFEAVNLITVPTANQIVRRSQLQAGDRVMWQYDSDAAQGSRLSFREVQ